MNDTHTNSKPTATGLLLKAGIWLSVILAFLLVAAGFVAWRWLHLEEKPALGDWANYGSYLQGTVASLWSLAGTLLIFVAFLAQKQQLIGQEAELEEQAKQFKKQHDSIKLQNFENSFFQLLNLHNQNVIQMTIRVEQHCSHPSEHGGRDCFRALHHQSHSVYGSRKKAEQNDDINFAANFYLELYEAHEASLGHYFRTLYHVIKFVNETDALKAEDADFEYKNRRRYTSLVRAQLSAFELEFLFYNGISGHGEKFKPLIEKFGLLENFDKKHLLHPCHEAFYAKSAFE